MAPTFVISVTLNFGMSHGWDLMFVWSDNERPKKTEVANLCIFIIIN